MQTNNAHYRERATANVDDIDAAKGSRFRHLSLGSLVKKLRDDAANLALREIELGKQELLSNSKKMVKDSLWLIIAGGIGICCVFVLLGAITTAIAGLLAMVMPMIWAVALAACIVAIALGTTAAICYAIGKKRLQKDSLKPNTTIESIRESKAWAREQMT